MAPTSGGATAGLRGLRGPGAGVPGPTPPTHCAQAGHPKPGGRPWSSTGGGQPGQTLAWGLEKDLLALPPHSRGSIRAPAEKSGASNQEHTNTPSRPRGAPTGSKWQVAFHWGEAKDSPRSDQGLSGAKQQLWWEGRGPHQAPAPPHQPPCNTQAGRATRRVWLLSVEGGQGLGPGPWPRGWRGQARTQWRWEAEPAGLGP